MKIELYGQQFNVYGYPVIEGNRSYAYATDPAGNIFLLFWPAGEEPEKRNVTLVRLEK